VALVSILKQAVQKAAVFAWEARFFFAGNDYFLRMYFPDENDLQSIARKNRFSMMPPDKRFSPFTSPRS
jgi:hypothetical protein